MRSKRRQERRDGRQVHVAGQLRHDDRASRDPDPQRRRRAFRSSAATTAARPRPASRPTRSRSGTTSPSPTRQRRAAASAAGAYDPPAEARGDVQELRRRSSQSLFELYGRKVELVKIQGTGAQHRRGRGQGRRRQGREPRARLRGHGRTGAGQAVLRRARGEARPVHRDVHHRPAAEATTRSTRRTCGRSDRRPTRPARSMVEY